MDTSLVIRVVAGVLFVVALGFLIMRRKNKSA
jgi:LPXTG-motif cell wall-anchored protein